jgi:hypothetical protein
MAMLCFFFTEKTQLIRNQQWFQPISLPGFSDPVLPQAETKTELISFPLDSSISSKLFFLEV